MTDLLTPDEVREILTQTKSVMGGHRPHTNAKWGPERPHLIDLLPRLCRDYLTLWDRNKELEERLTPKHYDWTDKPWVVRYFDEDMIGVISREKSRLQAEIVMMEYNDAGWIVDVQHDPHNLWGETAHA